jgi:hypothetical protein
MPYFTIQDFAAGLDLRRASHTAPAGTLRKLVNCHITPGGEIEKRFAFNKIATMPSNTRGIISLTRTLADGITLKYGLYCFGPGGPAITDPATDWAVGTIALATPAIHEIIDHDTFGGKVFVIIWSDASFNEQRFWDQALVTDANCKGNFCRTHKAKMFTVAGRKLYSSVVNNPGIWTDSPEGTPETSIVAGAGEVDLSLQDSEMTDCLSLEVYFDKMAIFSKTATQLWILDPDTQKYQYVQTLVSAGTIAWRSVKQYANGDVAFLAPDGIRSLKAINSSLMAAASDIGSPIDPLIQYLYRSLGEDYLSQAITLVQPVTGRLWVIMQDRIFILSAFPGPKISAWSEYVPTWQDPATGAQVKFRIVAACTYRNVVIVRDDQHNIYAFGRNPSSYEGVYDNCPVEAIFPFHAGENAATKKKFEGIDAACDGDWEVYASYLPTPNPQGDPRILDPEDYLGLLNGPSFEQGRFPIEGYATHMSLRLRSGKINYDASGNFLNITPGTGGAKKLSNMIIHYDLADSG